VSEESEGRNMSTGRAYPLVGRVSDTADTLMRGETQVREKHGDRSTSDGRTRLGLWLYSGGWWFQHKVVVAAGVG